MAARVIYFGFDDCYRVRVLQAAGYDVRESRSLVEIRTDLRREDGVAAVVVSSDEEQAEEAAILAESIAPVILFRRGTRAIDESKFDCIFESTVSPAVWLSQIEQVIARSGKLQEEARYLRPWNSMRTGQRRQADEGKSSSKEALREA